MNIVALVQPVEPTALDRLAERINVLFKHAAERDRLANKKQVEADASKRRGLEKRTHAGFALFEAKAALEAAEPGASFEAWCEANITHGMRDCYKCMALARDYEKHRCLGVALGRPQVIWDGHSVEADADGNVRPIPAVLIDQDQRPRSVKQIIGLFRKLPQEWRALVLAELEKINADS